MRNLLLPKRVVESQEFGPFVLPQLATICPCREIDEHLQLLRDGSFHFLHKVVGPLLEDWTLSLEVGKQLLRLVLGHETDELRQVVILGNRLLADESVFFPKLVESAFLRVIKK